MSRASWIETLRRSFPVRRGELVTVALLAINVFVLLSCYYVLKVAREPLILLGGGAELKAYAGAGQTLLLLAVVPAFGWLASRVDRIRLLTAVQSFFIVCLVAFFVLARAAAPIGLAFYLWLGIFNMMVVSNFWAFANDLYAPDDGKRLFPLIALGGSIGAILGALVPRWLTELFGVYPMMLVGAAGLAVSIVLYRLVDRRERIDRDPRGTVAVTKPEAVQPVGRAGGFQLVIQDRYLRLMALMILVATVSNTLGEYVVGRVVVEAAAGHADPRAFIGGFYSDYYTVVNLVSALLQGLVVARLIGHLGIRKVLFVMPLVMIGGWMAFFAFASLTAIRATKTVENSLDYSLHNTVRQALYLPTSRESKYKAKAAIDTFFVRMGDVIAGLGIVFVVVDVLELGVRAFVAINVALGVVWIALAIATGRLHDERTAERAARAARGLRETAV